MLCHATVLQCMFSDVPDGIVQEPLDAEMTRVGGWKGKFVFPTKHIFWSNQVAQSEIASSSSSASNLKPLFQHLDTPLPRLIDRIDGVRLRSQDGVGVINTEDFSRGAVPLQGFEYFAVMRGEHGARWVCMPALFLVLMYVASAAGSRGFADGGRLTMLMAAARLPSSCSSGQCLQAMLQFLKSRWLHWKAGGGG
jgi:hypothetical protein